MAGTGGPRPPPYGGPEETSEVRRQRRNTHGGGTLDSRMYIAEERAAAAEQAATNIGVQYAGLSEKFDRLTEAVTSLTNVLKGPEHRLEDGIAWKVADLYGWKKIIVRVGVSVLTACLIGALTWIVVLLRRGPQ